MSRGKFMMRQRRQTQNGTENAEGTGSVTPLDTFEQQEIVEKLTTEANQQATFFTRIFTGILLVCAAILVRCSIDLAIRGNEEPLPHRMVFERVPDAAFYVTYMGHLLGLYLAYKVAQGSGWHILPGVMVSWSSLFSWLAAFRHFGVTNPLLLWMPLGPAGILAFAVYLFVSQKRLEKELDELKGAQYNLKGA